jgi:alkylhydroperoxidase family enzyme
MSRIVPVVSSNIDAKVAATLSRVKASLGMVPNLFATLAHAPVALDGYLSLSKMLSRGRLSAAQREIVALAVGQEIERALGSLAKKIVRQRGHVADEDIENARKAGIDDGLMMEIVANVAVNTLTNYANELASTEIDFPLVEAKL